MGWYRRNRFGDPEETAAPQQRPSSEHFWREPIFVAMALLACPPIGLFLLEIYPYPKKDVFQSLLTIILLLSAIGVYRHFRPQGLEEHNEWMAHHYATAKVQSDESCTIVPPTAVPWYWSDRDAEIRDSHLKALEEARKKAESQHSQAPPAVAYRNDWEHLEALRVERRELACRIYFDSPSDCDAWIKRHYPTAQKQADGNYLVPATASLRRP
jgi:hypothetical protein